MSTFYSICYMISSELIIIRLILRNFNIKKINSLEINISAYENEIFSS